MGTLVTPRRVALPPPLAPVLQRQPAAPALALAQAPTPTRYQKWKGSYSGTLLLPSLLLS